MYMCFPPGASIVHAPRYLALLIHAFIFLQVIQVHYHSSFPVMDIVFPFLHVTQLFCCSSLVHFFLLPRRLCLLASRCIIIAATSFLYVLCNYFLVPEMNKDAAPRATAGTIQFGIFWVVACSC